MHSIRQRATRRQVDSGADCRVVIDAVPDQFDTFEAYRRFHHLDIATLDDLELQVERARALRALADAPNSWERRWWTARVRRLDAEIQRRSRSVAVPVSWVAP